MGPRCVLEHIRDENANFDFFSVFGAVSPCDSMPKPPKSRDFVPQRVLLAADGFQAVTSIQTGLGTHQGHYGALEARTRIDSERFGRFPGNLACQNLVKKSF